MFKMYKDIKWGYSDAESVDELPRNAIGFIYELYFKSGKKYIGKKTAISTITKPSKLNGTKRKNHFKFINKRKKMTEEDLANRTSTQLRNDVRTKLVKYEVIKKESDWREYVGSSKEISTDDVLVGKRILFFVSTLTSLSYLEEKMLFYYNACVSRDYYNKNIGGRYFDNALNGLILLQFIMIVKYIKYTFLSLIITIATILLLRVVENVLTFVIIPIFIFILIFLFKVNSSKSNKDTDSIYYKSIDPLQDILKKIDDKVAK